jgi:hypothetical protein
LAGLAPTDKAEIPSGIFQMVFSKWYWYFPSGIGIFQMVFQVVFFKWL